MADKMVKYTSSEVAYLWRHRGNTNYKYKGFLNNATFGHMVCFQDMRNRKDVVGKLVRKPFLGESFYWTRLDHVNIMPLLGLFDLDNEVTIFIMPKYDINLYDCIRDKDFYDSKKSYQRKKSYIKDTLCGLTYLHKRHISYMNLGKSKIFIDKQNDKAVISDFSNVTAFVSATFSLVQVPKLFFPPEFRNLLLSSRIEPESAEVYMYGVFVIQVLCCDLSQRQLPFFNSQSDVIRLRAISNFIENLDSTVLLDFNMGSIISKHEALKLRNFLKKLLCDEPNNRITLKEAISDVFFSHKIVDNSGKFDVSTKSEVYKERDQNHKMQIDSFVFPKWDNKSDAKLNIMAKTASRSESFSKKIESELLTENTRGGSFVPQNSKFIPSNMPITVTKTPDELKALTKNISSKFINANIKELDRIKRVSNCEVSIAGILEEMISVNVEKLICNQLHMEKGKNERNNEQQICNDKFVNFNSNTSVENGTEVCLARPKEDNLPLVNNFASTNLDKEVFEKESANDFTLNKPCNFTPDDKVALRLETKICKNSKSNGDNLNNECSYLKDIKFSSNLKCKVKAVTNGTMKHNKRITPDFIINKNFSFCPCVKQNLDNNENNTDLDKIVTMALCKNSLLEVNTQTCDDIDNKYNDNFDYSATSPCNSNRDASKTKLDFSYGDIKLNDKYNASVGSNICPPSSQEFDGGFMTVNGNKSELTINKLKDAYESANSFINKVFDDEEENAVPNFYGQHREKSLPGFKHTSIEKRGKKVQREYCIRNKKKNINKRFCVIL